MITPQDIERKARRKYGAFLRSIVRAEPFFPLELRYGARKPQGTYHTFEQGREALLQASKEVRGVGYKVDLEEHRTRRHGTQRVPVGISFESEEDYTAFLAKTAEVRAFRRAVETTRKKLPELLDWMARRPKRVVSYRNVWEDLLNVASYLRDHPRPGCYVRELPLAVHTKFVEQHASVLKQMLDRALPPEAIEQQASKFTVRYGFKRSEPLVRIRALDPDLRVEHALPVDDLSTPLPEFAALELRGRRFVISENKMTFLTLPPLTDSFGLWGGGFRVEMLKHVPWLAHCPIVYWGDLDAHGFEILARLRSAFPHVRSLMMDEATFQAFEHFAVPGTPTDVEHLPHLTHQEERLYRRLAEANLRLEQEHISHAYVTQMLAHLEASPAE